MGNGMIYGLIFLSGFAGLVYQVLWMKQLGLLFGSTSHAAAATLAAFFAGLAVGGWFWGRRAARMRNPLRAYAWLQVGIAATAVMYFVILALFYRFYPALYQHVDAHTLLLAIKFGLSLLLIFPPAFCMGGTIPVMGQHVIRNLARFGVVSALLYGVNTLGAALGAYFAGFHLPLWLGFNATYAGAMAITAGVAAVAFLLASQPGAAVYKPKAVSAAMVRPLRRKGRWPLLAVCFLSGFGVLALEVVWTRMFTQVLENSVYTFSAILVVVLLCLAGGALISSLLARLAVPPRYLLAGLLLLGGVAVSVTPFVFMRLTDNLQILVSMGTWPEYMLLIFRNVVLTIGLPALVLGTVFPFLMKAEEAYADSAGRSIGALTAVNTVGAVLGALVCGFVLLEWLGMWRTMQVLAVLYLAGALVLPVGWDAKGIAIKLAVILVLLLQFAGLDPSGLPINSVDSMRPDELILETWEGSDCTVAVAQSRHGLSIKINSHYGLGSTGALMPQRMQAALPLMVYPETESIFFLGAGTGITAGSALDPQFAHVKRIIACELVPEVVTAARTYITNVNGYDFTGGLFSDPRARVLVEDGRHYLMASGERFDMVNSDLFVPFRSGAGSLYSREHFRSVQASLNPGGVFVQWLPLYQLTEYEVMIIARTMLDVFDQVTLWRNNFQPGEEVIAMVGHRDAAPLSATALDSREDKRLAVAGKGVCDLEQLQLPLNSQTILFFYGGNMTAAADLFADYPLNTDDKPLIEYMAPRTCRNRKDTAIPWYVGPRLAELVDEIQRRCPPESDPFLANRSEADRRLPVAGAAYHWARIWDVIGDPVKCHAAWARFLREWLSE